MKQHYVRCRSASERARSERKRQQAKKYLALRKKKLQCSLELTPPKVGKKDGGTHATMGSTSCVDMMPGYYLTAAPRSRGEVISRRGSILNDCDYRCSFPPVLQAHVALKGLIKNPYQLYTYWGIVFSACRIVCAPHSIDLIN